MEGLGIMSQCHWPSKETSEQNLQGTLTLRPGNEIYRLLVWKLRLPPQPPTAQVLNDGLGSKRRFCGNYVTCIWEFMFTCGWVWKKKSSKNCFLSLELKRFLSKSSRAFGVFTDVSQVHPCPQARAHSKYWTVPHSSSQLCCVTLWSITHLHCFLQFFPSPPPFLFFCSYFQS